MPSTDIVINALPSQQSQFESLQRELFARNRQLTEAEHKIEQLEGELKQERLKTKQIERGMVTLRQILSPLHHGLRMVFGELDEMDIEDQPQPARSAAPGMTPEKSAAWESWKKKMPGIRAQIIDLLMIHGELTSEQLRLHVGTKRKQSIYEATFALTKASVIDKTGDKFSLKKL